MCTRSGVECLKFARGRSSQGCEECPELKGQPITSRLTLKVLKSTLSADARL